VFPSVARCRSGAGGGRRDSTGLLRFDCMGSTGNDRKTAGGAVLSDPPKPEPEGKTA
jgi:hypothetical protein